MEYHRLVLNYLLPTVWEKQLKEAAFRPIYGGRAVLKSRTYSAPASSQLATATRDPPQAALKQLTWFHDAPLATQASVPHSTIPLSPQYEAADVGVPDDSCKIHVGQALVLVVSMMHVRLSVVGFAVEDRGAGGRTRLILHLRS